MAGPLFPQQVDAYNSVRPVIPALRGVRPPPLPRSPPPSPSPPHHHHPPLLSVIAAQFIKFSPLLPFHANPSVDTSFTSRPHPPRSLSRVAAVGRQLHTSAPGLTGTRCARQTAQGTSGRRVRLQCHIQPPGEHWQPQKVEACHLSALRLRALVQDHVIARNCPTRHRSSASWLRSSKCKFRVSLIINMFKYKKTDIIIIIIIMNIIIIIGVIFH